MKIKSEHKDILGNIIEENSKLAVSHHNELKICSIVKILPKMLRVKPLHGYYREGFLVHDKQTVIVDGPDVTAYMLKGPGND